MEFRCNEPRALHDAALLPLHHEVTAAAAEPEASFSSIKKKKFCLLTFSAGSSSCVLFSAVSRREIRDAGMTLIFDAKRTNPPPQLYKAMMEFQVSGAQR